MCGEGVVGKTVGGVLELSPPSVCAPMYAVSRWRELLPSMKIRSNYRFGTVRWRVANSTILYPPHTGFLVISSHRQSSFAAQMTSTGSVSSTIAPPDVSTGTAEGSIEKALSRFESLSIEASASNNRRRTDEGRGARSKSFSAFSRKQRNTPYTLPESFTRRSNIPQRPETNDSSDNKLSRVRLPNCQFSGPLDGVRTSPSLAKCDSESKQLRNAKPCWLQYRQRASESNLHHGGALRETVFDEFVENERDEIAGVQRREDFEVGELTEYFEHFVRVQLKMPSQVEQMYV